MQIDSLQHKEMGQGPYRLEKAPARLHIVYLCLLEAIPVQSDWSGLVQEADLRYAGNDLILSETALTSQESELKLLLFRQPITILTGEFLTPSDRIGDRGFSKGKTVRQLFLGDSQLPHGPKTE